MKMNGVNLSNICDINKKRFFIGTINETPKTTNEKFYKMTVLVEILFFF